MAESEKENENENENLGASVDVEDMHRADGHGASDPVEVRILLRKYILTCTHTYTISVCMSAMVPLIVEPPPSVSRILFCVVLSVWSCVLTVVLVALIIVFAKDKLAA